MSTFEWRQKTEEATENSYVVLPVGLEESSLVRMSDAPCQGDDGAPPAGLVWLRSGGSAD